MVKAAARARLDRRDPRDARDPHLDQARRRGPDPDLPRDRRRPRARRLTLTNEGPVASPTPSPGSIIGSKYRIVRLLGEGGMGAVFEAENTLTRQARRASSGCTRSSRQTPRRCERFLREAQASARIRHPNVVDVYDVVQEGERGLHRDGAARGRAAQRAARARRRAAARARSAGCSTAMRGVAGGARAGRHPPRHQAGQHLPRAPGGRRPLRAQGARLRHLQAASGRRACR